MGTVNIEGLAQSMMGGNPKKSENKKPMRKTSHPEKKFDGYVGAPYNFVPVAKKPYKYPDNRVTAHNDMDERLISGEISYEITAETPIMISDGKENENDKAREAFFYKNSQEEYAIPGSTMRGLIRNNVQVLGFSSLYDDMDDYALMYRNVTNRAEQGRYNRILGSGQITINTENGQQNISVLKNVKAGYLLKKAGKYYIYRTSVDTIGKKFEEMNYYVLSERKIVDEYRKWKPGNGKFAYDFFTSHKPLLTQHEMEPFIKSIDRNGRVHYKGVPNKLYEPYFKEASYRIKNLKDVVAVGEPGVYENQGYVISTGKMDQKKAVYIIPEIDRTKEPIPIPDSDVTAFKIDFNKRKNSLKNFGKEEFFNLPEEGILKPVFYIQLGEKLYFGFTPRLRLFYDYTVKNGLKQEYEKGMVDYAKAMFGYSNQAGSYKSRVSFSDAVFSGKNVRNAHTEKVILAEPKPTSYLDYLKQDDKADVTYNNSDFEIRGIKQYWLHKKPSGLEVQGKDNVALLLHPLEKGSKFNGKVRFHNLTKDEFGLLLWSIQLRKESWMNVGKAKSFGYGNISVKITSVREFDKQKAYLSDSLLELDPFHPVSIEEYISFYKKFISDKLKIKDIEETPEIRTFFEMKDSTRIPDEKDIHYMDINKKEYQNRKNRKIPLPLVEEIIKKGN